MTASNDEIREELNRLRSTVSVLERRVNALEGGQVREVSYPATTSRASSLSGFRGERRPESKGGLEVDIGKKLFSIVGVVSIFFGLIFFVVYTLSQDFLGPVGKITAGVIVGLILLVLGEVLDRKKYMWFSRSVTGGGFLALYLSTYAAYGLYNLIPKEASIVLLIILVAFGVLFSLKYKSAIIASEVFLLGYLVSFIGGVPDFSLVYVLILGAGLLVIAYWKDWFGLGIGGMLMTYIIYVAWYFSHKYHEMQKPDDFPISAAFLIAYFLLYTLMSFAPRLRRNYSGQNVTGTLITLLNAPIFYLLFLWRLDNTDTAFCGFFSVIVGVVYLFIGYVMAALQDKSLFKLSLIFCLTFITLAAPIQTDDTIVTIVWCLEAFVLLAIGFIFRNKLFRQFGLAVLIITIFKVFLVDLAWLSTLYRIISFIVLGIILLVTSLVYSKFSSITEEERK